jgi:hypothetical protein
MTQDVSEQRRVVAFDSAERCHQYDVSRTSR